MPRNRGVEVTRLQIEADYQALARLTLARRRNPDFDRLRREFERDHAERLERLERTEREL